MAARVLLESMTLPTPPSEPVNVGTLRPAKRGARHASTQICSRVSGLSSAARDTLRAEARANAELAANRGGLQVLLLLGMEIL